MKPDFDILDFGEPEKENSIIKVIGVGGGGGNAVNHMYREGIHDVSFVLCNTDNQALNDSPVPIHLQLGKEGLGCDCFFVSLRSERVSEMLTSST